MEHVNHSWTQKLLMLSHVELSITTVCGFDLTPTL